jgi:hypothetical protein
MDLQEIVAQLKSERDKIDHAVQALEKINGGAQMITKRGRPPMNEASKKEVSRRMRSYWASRRDAV